MQETQKTGLWSLGREDPLEEEMAWDWPGKSHGLRNLLGYRPWDSKESDMAEQLSIDTHTCQRSHFGGNKCWPNPVGWLTTKGFQSLVYPNEVCKRSLRHLFNMSISNIYSQMLSETSYSEINYSVKWESTGPFLLPDGCYLFTGRVLGDVYWFIDILVVWLPWL